jgi:beta-N-acetylhexosaminidase
MRRPSPASTVLQIAVVLVVGALLVAGCAREGDSARKKTAIEQGDHAKPATSPAVEAPKADSARAPAEVLPLDVLAGELVMTKLVGPVASPEELESIRTLQVGGIILFGPSVQDEPQLRALLRSLDAARAPGATRAKLHPRLLVSVDQEGGTIRNVPFAPPEHTQPELAGGSAAAAREEARRTGRALAELGISMDLGPVADLVEPPNRTMAGRSVGSEPDRVAPLVGATVAGLQAGGVAAVAKHFPGFGASTANSDEAVAFVDRTKQELLDAELVPFRAAIAAGVDAVMVSHGIHRRLGSTLPGTIDARIATGLLRDELGFTGVAMTDSMNARGFREGWGDTVPRACPRAIAAGIDLLLLTGTIETARLCRARILDAVRDGSLPEARVREAATRVMELRARVAP